jgi:hypothetical protein
MEACGLVFSFSFVAIYFFPIFLAFLACQPFISFQINILPFLHFLRFLCRDRVQFLFATRELAGWCGPLG